MDQERFMELYQQKIGAMGGNFIDGIPGAYDDGMSGNFLGGKLRARGVALRKKPEVVKRKALKIPKKPAIRGHANPWLHYLALERAKPINAKLTYKELLQYTDKKAYAVWKARHYSTISEKLKPKSFSESARAIKTKPARVPKIVAESKVPRTRISVVVPGAKPPRMVARKAPAKKAPAEKAPAKKKNLKSRLAMFTKTARRNYAEFVVRGLESFDEIGPVEVEYLIRYISDLLKRENDNTYLIEKINDLADDLTTGLTRRDLNLVGLAVQDYKRNNDFQVEEKEMEGSGLRFR